MNLQACFWIVIVGVLASNIVEAQCQNMATEIVYKEACTKIQTYKSKKLSKNPILLVAIHGDSPPGFHTGAHYDFAKNIAGKSINLVAVGLTRPGYTDAMGRTSDGVEGEGVGDNYDETRIKQIVGAIKRLIKNYQAGRVILVGQSGGAAVVANLIGLYPGFVDHAFLLACPCDINAWRKQMFGRTKKSVFKGDLTNTSPIDIVDKIPRNTSITMFAGMHDKVTKLSLIKTYESALIDAGKIVKLHVIQGGHEIFMRPEVLNEVAVVVENYNKSSRQIIR